MGPSWIAGPASDSSPTEGSVISQTTEYALRIIVYLASLDGLTGVANRRRFDAALVQAWHAAEGRPLSLVLIDIDLPEEVAAITVLHGSITINGVSLTCFNSTADEFSVAIIPYTYEHTGFHQLQAGERVNLEFDIVGKYVAKLLASQGLIASAEA